MGLRDNLILCYESEENTGTVANSAHNPSASNVGTLTSGATWGAGKIGRAVALDGVDDYVSTPAGLGIDNVARISVGFWMFLHLTPNNYDIMCSHQVALNDRFEIGVGGPGVGTIASANLNISVGGVTASAWNASGSGNIQFANSIWYHILGVYDGTLSGNIERCKIYINGVRQVLTYAGTFPALSANIAAAVTIWGQRLAGALALPARLDQMALWNGAKTQYDATRLFNGGFGLPFRQWNESASGTTRPGLGVVTPATEIPNYYRLNR